jgi:hypothetical protein
MKMFIASILFLGLAAQAEEPSMILNFNKLSCVVPVQEGSPSVNLEITLANDMSVDFVTLTLTGPKAQKDVLFIQLEKGAFEKQLSAGSIGTLVIQEGFGQENGVVKKAGFLVLNRDGAGNFSGMMAALSNIYPLSCGPVN